jgi:uncharacterized protein YtpQ (UPF0354 family)
MTWLAALSGWLGRAKADKRRFADIAEFRELVMAAFRRQPGVDSVVADSSDPAKLVIAMAGQSVTGDVTNIFGYLNNYPDEDADRQIDRFIRSVIDVKTRIVSDENIVAVIRNREYIDQFRSNGLDFLHEPLGADLTTVYMADRPDSMSPLRAKDVPGKDLQNVRNIAFANMRHWLPKVVADGQLRLGVLYFVEGNTMLSTSLILLDEFWKSIETRFPGDVLIALPRRDQLFIFDDGNASAEAMARRMIDVTTRENFNLLSPKLYARRHGKIVLAAN